MNTQTKAIYFDMDGTIADLYNVEGWLELLQSCDPEPYRRAAPLLRLNQLARRLNQLQRQGYHIGIISWLSKNSNRAYDKRVTIEKVNWLHRHLKSVKWNEVKIVEYGVPKHKVVDYPNGILFDDEKKNRIEWSGKAYDETDIMNVLKAIS